MSRVRALGEAVRRRRRAVVWGVFAVTAVGTWFFGLPFTLVGGVVAWRLTKVLGPDAWCGSCAAGACDLPEAAAELGDGRVSGRPRLDPETHAHRDAPAGVGPVAAREGIDVGQ